MEKRYLVAGTLATLIIACIGAQAQVSQVWERRYNGTAGQDDVANAITVNVFGQAIVTGRSTESGTGVDIMTRAYNLNGTPAWQALYDGSASGGSDEGVALVVDNEGNVFVGGNLARSFDWQ